MTCELPRPSYSTTCRMLTDISSIMGWTEDAAQNMVDATAADYK